VKSFDRYDAIWFDASDTIITIPETETLLQSYLADRSIHKSKEQIIAALGDAFTHRYYGWKPEDFTACTPQSDQLYWVNFYRYVLDKLGIVSVVDDDRIRTMCLELYDLYLSPQHYVLFEDVVPVLQRLAERGKRMAVVSNFAPNLPHILRDKGIADYLEAIVVSTLVGYEKPDPRIFQHTLDITGMTSSEVLYIGDHETNDIWAPAQVGIDAVRIKRYSYQQGEGITSLHDLFD